MRRVCLSAIVILVTLMAWPAGANTIQDGRDSVGRHPDIKSVTATHDGSEVTLTATTYRSFVTLKGPCFYLKSDVEYILCTRGSIYEIHGGAQAGTADVSRPSDRSIAYRFDSEVIGSPDSYRWAAVVLSTRCPDGTCDLAPDRGWVRESLA
jgi:hypothetical protein